MTYEYAKREFYIRLEERAFITAQIFLEKDELSKDSYEPYKTKFVQSLPKEVIQVVDSYNDYVFVEKSKKELYTKELLEKIRSEKEMRFEKENRQYVGLFYRDNQGDFIILVSAYDFDGKSKLKNLLTVLLISYFVSILIIYVLGHFFSKQALRPINSIVNQVKKISASNLHLRIKENNNKDEINELSITFNNMLSRLDDSFEMQKTFIANASHELRTPITTVISETEILLSKDRSNDEYKQALSSVLTEFDRLKEIVNSLLNLAQANFDITALGYKDLRVDEIIMDSREDVVRKIKGVDISVEFNNLPNDSSLLVIQGNQSLLNIAFANILNNACKFSENKKVTCLLNYNTNNNLIEITITDKGIGISPKDIQSIFQPFYRGNNARVFNGHGIGLALSEKIINIHNGKISVTSELNVGTAFLITFPIKS